jgi:D-threo-aldose 1-dehydrogenase
VLPVRSLPGTGVTTSAVGFGCAGLFGLPGRAGRRTLLEAVYDAGIRHFDVAPMYGLGLAEAELASFLKGRRADVTVTTKFGIEPALLTRAIAPFQGPVRVFLASRPNVRAGLRNSGRGPRAGPVGRLLYSSPGYGRRAAQLSLERSLRALGTDYVDVFLLHDPAGDLARAAELACYLDEQQRLGRIRCWGVTGQPAGLSRPGRVLQVRDDIFGPPPRPDGAAMITFGALARALPVLRRFLARSPGAIRAWSDRLGTDLAEEPALPRTLLRLALARNPGGPVLFSTIRAERGRVAAEAALGAPVSPAEAATFSELAAASLACPGPAGPS